ncbi:PDZ domain-containing RING finger protein 4 [Elysia marginata]|uniref:PDZ domain-containing RING finger protein 4 n=1 Tax=Elysia marginata TaxID=1093978 RepID=A0AAV4G626_9GAST|nr:PDZ domain-containing RING finger protein 4 [Elysia marginata]
MGLTDIEMAHTLDIDDPFFDDRQYEMVYELVKACLDFFAAQNCLPEPSWNQMIPSLEISRLSLISCWSVAPISLISARS